MMARGVKPQTPAPPDDPEDPRAVGLASERLQRFA